jgi:hypothetical protein
MNPALEQEDGCDSDDGLVGGSNFSRCSPMPLRRLNFPRSGDHHSPNNMQPQEGHYSTAKSGCLHTALPTRLDLDLKGGTFSALCGMVKKTCAP